MKEGGKISFKTIIWKEEDEATLSSVHNLDLFSFLIQGSVRQLLKVLGVLWTDGQY